MKARIPKHREFIINFPDSVDNAKANEGWAKLQQIVEDYKKTHNGASVYAPTFIEDCEPAVKKLQEEYSHPHLETVGPKLRAMFSWNNQVDADADMAESFNGKIARTQVQ